MFTESSLKISPCYINIFYVLDPIDCIESEELCFQREKIEPLMIYLMVIPKPIIIARKIFFFFQQQIFFLLGIERHTNEYCPKIFNLLSTY